MMRTTLLTWLDYFIFSFNSYCLEITLIGIIDYGGVTSAFGCYLYSAMKVDNTGYSSLISNAHKLKKYILITMNCCKKRLLLPLEDDSLTGDDIILVYHTHILIGFTMKEEIVSPDHAKPNRLWRSAVVLVQLVVEVWFQVPRRQRRRHSYRLSTPPSCRLRRRCCLRRRLTSLSHRLTSGGGERSRVCRRIVTVVLSYDPSRERRTCAGGTSKLRTNDAIVPKFEGT